MDNQIIRQNVFIHTLFNIIVKKRLGKYIYKASNLEQAFNIFREKLEENPDRLVVLECDMKNSDTYESLAGAMEIW